MRTIKIRQFIPSEHPRHLLKPLSMNVAATVTCERKYIVSDTSGVPQQPYRTEELIGNYGYETITTYHIEPMIGMFSSVVTQYTIYRHMETMIRVGGKWYGVHPIDSSDILKLYATEQPIYFISLTFRRPIYHIHQRRDNEYFIDHHLRYLLTSRCGGLTERFPRSDFRYRPIVFDQPPPGFLPCARCFPDAIQTYRKNLLNLFNVYKETQRPKELTQNKAALQWAHEFEEVTLFG